MIVVVSQPALASYVERLLPALDVGGVKVHAYRAWAKGIVDRLVGKHGRRVIGDAPPEVSRLKKHPALLAALREQVERRVREVDAALAAALAGKPGGDALLNAWRASFGLPVLPRLAAFLAHVDEAAQTRRVPDDTAERARRAAESVRKKAADFVGEWEELVTDRGLLARVLEEAPRLDAQAFDAALRWTKRQVEEEEDLSDVDDDAKTPVDEMGPDEDDPIHAFDPHDLPLLLGIAIARTGALAGKNGKPIEYDHVVVDEAQDFSAVELWPLLVSTGDRRSMTLAGDVVQKVVFDNGFADWGELVRQLGVPARAVEPLQLSYRSTSQVVGFAREVLGPLAPKEPPKAVRSGAPVEVFSFDDPGEEIAFLAENLRAVMGREPTANVALLCRYPERARFYADMLDAAEVPRLRLVLGEDFTFSPGIDVTTIGLVKGLEYDYVVLAEVTEAMYPDAHGARHLLHIGATRAAHQLWITTHAADPSPLLPRAMLEER
jgi:DNA helicase II / ATP-dependent DNA helicase PcrA